VAASSSSQLLVVAALWQSGHDESSRSSAGICGAAFILLVESSPI
jgi:hypothetical protein